jgi:hypothetical protein
MIPALLARALIRAAIAAAVWVAIARLADALEFSERSRWRR